MHDCNTKPGIYTQKVSNSYSKGPQTTYLLQNIYFDVIFRRKLMEQQNLARMNGGHAHGTPGGLMPPGGNVMGTPTSGIAQRGLNGMSPAPQQIARPRKILFFVCMLFTFYLLSSVVCYTYSVSNCN